MNQLLQFPWLLVAMYSCCNCIGVVLLKQSRLVVDHSSFWMKIFSPWVISALLVYCTGLLMLARALDSLPASAVIPFSSGLGFIVISILSYYLFGERLTLNQITAIGIIFIGIVVLTR